LSRDGEIVEPGVSGYVVQHSESIIRDQTNGRVVDIINVERVLENIATAFESCVGAIHREVIHECRHVRHVVAIRCNVCWRVGT